MTPTKILLDGYGRRIGDPMVASLAVLVGFAGVCVAGIVAIIA